MSRASNARRQRRALKQAGIALVDRVTIDGGALAAGALAGGNLVDLVAYQIGEALTRLDAQGGDIIGGRTVVTIGAHPDYPGELTIEAKVASLKREVDPDPGCMLDHSLDAMDEDDAPSHLGIPGAVDWVDPAEEADD